MNDSRWVTGGRWLGVAVGLNVTVLAIAYMLYPGYVDHGEAAISAMAWKMLEGTPVYHGFQSADRVTNLYGPFVYLWYAWPLALFGGSVTTGKIAAALAAILLPVSAWAIARRRTSMVGWIVAFAGAMVIIHLNAPVVIRPDALLTLMVAVAVLCLPKAGDRAGWAWAVLIGIAGGVAVNIKIHAAIYLAPAALYLLWSDWRRLVPMTSAGLVVAVLPFAFPIFPIADYLSWFGPMASKENVWFGFTLLWWKLLLYFLPMILLALGGQSAWSRCDTRTRIYGISYAASLLIVLFPATKFGGGDHYLMPFLPLTVDLAVRALKLVGETKVQRWVVALIVLVVIGAGYQPQRRLYKKMEWDKSAQVVAEIEQIMADHSGKRIQMGVGRVPAESGDQLSFHFYTWRNVPVYRGHPYTIDAGIMMELTKLGVAFPEESLQRLATCHTDIWLVPKDGRPFELQGYYRQQVFSDEVRGVFNQHHRKIDSRQFFDLWQCTP